VWVRKGWKSLFRRPALKRFVRPALRRAPPSAAGIDAIRPICPTSAKRSACSCRCAASIAATRPVGARPLLQPLPELLSPRARRTQRLATAQGRLGVACGGEAGARLLQRLAMPTSADTVLRLVRVLPLPLSETPRAVGVDDWALKKGQTYGTIRGVSRTIAG
jgi:hypothetical protein